MEFTVKVLVRSSGVTSAMPISKDSVATPALTNTHCMYDRQQTWIDMDRLSSTCGIVVEGLNDGGLADRSGSVDKLYPL